MSAAKAAAKAQPSNAASIEFKAVEKKLLYSVLTHLQGRINFEKIAADIEVPNAEAARKRLRRFLEKESIPTTIKGDQIGVMEANSGIGSATTPVKAAAKTVKAKKAKPEKAETSTEEMATNTAGRKRKATEMDEGGEASNGG